MNLQQNLSNFMNAIRSSRNQSITEFSRELGISRSEMQNILKGTCNPRLDTVCYIAEKLDVHASLLLFSSLSKSQLDYSLLLLKTLDCFCSIPYEKQKEASELFCKLLVLITQKH